MTSAAVAAVLLGFGGAAAFATESEITSNFNGTNSANGSVVWFSHHLTHVSGSPAPITLVFDEANLGSWAELMRQSHIPSTRRLLEKLDLTRYEASFARAHNVALRESTVELRCPTEK